MLSCGGWRTRPRAVIRARHANGDDVGIALEQGLELFDVGENAGFGGFGERPGLVLVVGKPDHGLATLGADGVDELLDHRGRSLDDLPSGDLVDRLLIKDPYPSRHLFHQSSS